MKILEFSMLSYFSGRFEIEPSKYFKANKFGKYFKYWRVYQPAPGVRTFQLFASPLQSWKSDKTHHHSISRLFIMYPQRTPPESGMEKSGRRNLISSQCLACYVNLPTSPRLSCTRADFSVFFKSYQIGKKNRPSITLSKCYNVTYSHVSHQAGSLNPPSTRLPRAVWSKEHIKFPTSSPTDPPSVQLRNIGQNINWDTLLSAVFFLHEKCKSDLNNVPLVKMMWFVS